MTTRDGIPGYLRLAWSAIAAGGIVSAFWRGRPSWVSLLAIVLLAGVLVLVAREVVRRPGMIRAGLALWIVAGAILVVVVLSLAVHALS